MGDKIYVCNDERNCYASEVSLLLERTAGKNSFGNHFNETANVKYFDIKFTGSVDSRTMTMFTGDIEISMRGWGKVIFVSKSRFQAQSERFQDARLIMFINDKNIIEAANQFLDEEQDKDVIRSNPIFGIISAHYIEEMYGDYGSHDRRKISEEFIAAAAESMFNDTINMNQFKTAAKSANSVCVMRLEAKTKCIADLLRTKKPLESIDGGNLATKLDHIIFFTNQDGENAAPLVEIFKKGVGRVFSGCIDNQYAISQAAKLVGIRHDW